MEIRKAWVTVAAREFERSLEFYRQLLGQDPIVHTPNIYAEFEVSGVRLGIYKPRQNESPPTAYCLLPTAYSPLSLCFQVEDLTAAIEHLTTLGYPPPGEIIQASHGQELYAYDPDGNRLILYQPLQN